jgi:hypothetical protein
MKTLVTFGNTETTSEQRKIEIKLAPRKLPVYCVFVFFFPPCSDFLGVLQRCFKRHCCPHCPEVGPLGFRPASGLSTCLHNPSPFWPPWGPVHRRTTTAAPVGLIKTGISPCVLLLQAKHRYVLAEYQRRVNFPDAEIRVPVSRTESDVSPGNVSW